MEDKDRLAGGAELTLGDIFLSKGGWYVTLAELRAFYTVGVSEYQVTVSIIALDKFPGEPLSADLLSVSIGNYTYAIGYSKGKFPVHRRHRYGEDAEAEFHRLNPKD